MERSKPARSGHRLNDSFIYESDSPASPESSCGEALHAAPWLSLYPASANACAKNLPFGSDSSVNRRTVLWLHKAHLPDTHGAHLLCISGPFSPEENGLPSS